MKSDILRVFTALLFFMVIVGAGILLYIEEKANENIETMSEVKEVVKVGQTWYYDTENPSTPKRYYRKIISIEGEYCQYVQATNLKDLNEYAKNPGFYSSGKTVIQMKGFKRLTTD